MTCQNQHQQLLTTSVKHLLYITHKSHHCNKIYSIRSYIRLSHFLIDKFDYMDTFLHASPSWYDGINTYTYTCSNGIRHRPIRCTSLRSGHYISMICHCVDKFVPLDYRFSNWNIDFPLIGHPLRSANQTFNEHSSAPHSTTQRIWERSGNIWFGVYACGVKYARVVDSDFILQIEMVSYRRLGTFMRQSFWVNLYNLISLYILILFLSIK